MGNRAVITTKEKSIGLYVHWNGGRASIEGFLAACDELGFRDPAYDNYGWARLAEVCAVFFGNDGLCVGIDRYDRLDRDNGDNGVYIIEGWKIIGREFFTGPEEIDPEKTKKIKEYIINCLRKTEEVNDEEQKGGE